MNRERWRRSLGLVALVGVGLLPAAPAAASWPGDNGLIVYDSAVGNVADGSPFYALNWDQFGVLGNGQGRRPLVTTELGDIGAAWSPDGRHLVEIRDGGPLEGGSNEIVIRSAVGVLERVVTGGPQVLQDPSFSPDATQIVYEDDITDADVYVINVDGTGRRLLTPNSPERDDAPVWSPDGTKILLTATLSPPTAGDPREIQTMNPDGSGRKSVTTNDFLDTAPEWSPDGTEVVYLASPDNKDLETFTMSADGSHIRRLTRNDYRDWEPTWSPDGTRIAQAAFGTDAYYDGSSDIVVMRTDGSKRRSVTAPNSVDDQAPDWQAAGVECVEVVWGSAGRDRLTTPGRAARLLGLGGRDTLRGGAGDDCLMGATGDDRLIGARGGDFLAGGFGDDRIEGGPGGDRVWGGPGEDEIDVRGGGADHVDCGWDRDEVRADARDELRRCEPGGER